MNEQPWQQQSTSPLVQVQDAKMWYPVTGSGIVRRRIGWIKAVDGVSFSIGNGETLGLVGESGSGKTTTGRLVLALEKPVSGTIEFDGKDLGALTTRELRSVRKNMQIIFQDPFSSLNPRMSVAQIVADPLLAQRMITRKADLRERVASILRLVGLDPAMGRRFPHQLSGGQRQRVGIARAIVMEPKLVVCDEAVSALDVSIQAQIVNLLVDLQARLSLTFLFISHDLAVVRHISNRVAVMYLGHIVEIARSEELYANALHPYTKALLSAVPIPDPLKERRRDRIVLQGEIPSAQNPPHGCVFQSRCPLKIRACEEIRPALEEKGPEHLVACIRV